MRLVTVKCPKCHEVLEVDPQSGAVVRHREEVKPKAGADFFGERLRQIGQEQARREALIAEGRQREEAKRGEFDQLFRKAKEQSGKPAEKPLREIDVD